MPLDPNYQRIRDVINDCAGYRILDDDDVVVPTDETACASVLGGDPDADWSAVGKYSDLRIFVGRAVSELNDPNRNREFDAEERLFRRRIGK